MNGPGQGADSTDSSLNGKMCCGRAEEDTESERVEQKMSELWSPGYRGKQLNLAQCWVLGLQK